MFQSFTATTAPETGPARLQALRAEIAREGLIGMLVPRADLHQGEYVAACDERLAWLTGFTGSAGFCIVLPDVAGVFIDGRYRVQVRAQVADCFTPVHWPEVQPGPWIAQMQGEIAGRIGFDPWLHTKREIDGIRAALPAHIELVPCNNLIDRIWHDRPAPPQAPARAHPIEFAGESSEAKRTRIAASLAPARACVLTLPDSICWLLNIRGADIPRNPVTHALAILQENGALALYAEPTKFAGLEDHLGPQVTLHPQSDLTPALRQLNGPVRVDPASAPWQIGAELAEAGIEITWAEDPCILPKAVKNAAEIKGMEAAHLRDGAAMVEFLAWLETEAPKETLTEIDVVTRLEAARAASNELIDISFDTICGAGPHGAIVHYRVTHGSNRAVKAGELLLVDSGGQYRDGTTDITRTLAVGPVQEEARAPYTRVLQGMIALSRARFPRGVAGAHLDALARAPLWMAGQDFDHGTGHGVGAALCVHEGPARISRVSDLPLREGMILSNEPGYYREGAFGIRIENLVRVIKAPDLGDNRDQLAFETLTLCPIDTRLIDLELLSTQERCWLNAYHARVDSALGSRVAPETRDWLARACAPI
jgi:Xaa-Pro aminopeptidase